jgi:hypothetical protein
MIQTTKTETAHTQSCRRLRSIGCPPAQAYRPALEEGSQIAA